MPFISSSKPRSSKSESASEGGLEPGQGRILFLSSCWVLALLPLPGAFRNRFHDRSTGGTRYLDLGLSADITRLSVREKKLYFGSGLHFACIRVHSTFVGF